jgi:hypothetical protein
MGRGKIDVQQVGWSEQIKEDVSISGSFTVDGSTKVNSNSLVNQKAIQFDGLTPFDEVTISDATTDTSFSSGGGTDKPFTISMWVNLEEIDYDGTNGKHAGGLYTKRSTSPNDGEIYIGVGSGLLQIILYADPDQNGVGTFSTSNRIFVAQTSANNKFFHAENTWFHLCVSYDGSKALTGIRVYKNSHPVGQESVYEGGGFSTTNDDLNVPDLIYFTTQTSTNYSGMPQTSIPTTLGGIDVNDSTSNALAGKLADVCRFNRVLTPTEVQELYNDGNVKNMEEHSAYSDLVHWWKMGDHIDTTGQDGIKDYVGGYHGTLDGDAAIVSETTLGSDVSSTIHFNTSGSVGIGTSNPGAELDVVGNSKFLGDMDVDGILSCSGSIKIHKNSTDVFPQLHIHEDESEYGRISFTNNSDTSGSITGYSHEWTLAGKSAAENSASDAQFNIFYGGHNGANGLDLFSVLGNGDGILKGTLALNCYQEDGSTSKSDPSLRVGHAHIYSKVVSGHAEVFVSDSNQNVTQISPHNPEGEWQYFSKNLRTGKVVRINMEKMIRKLEEITGESFMEEWYE